MTKQYLWIDGVEQFKVKFDPKDRYSTLSRTEYDKLEKSFSGIKKEKFDLQNLIGTIHPKTINGKEYWYSWKNGKWKSVGKENPVPKMEKKISDIDNKMSDMTKKLEKKLVAVNEELKDLILKTFQNKHYIIDEGMVKHVVASKYFKNETIIKLSEILAAAEEICG